MYRLYFPDTAYREARARFFSDQHPNLHERVLAYRLNRHEHPSSSRQIYRLSRRTRVFTSQTTLYFYFGILLSLLQIRANPNSLSLSPPSPEIRAGISIAILEAFLSRASLPSVQSRGRPGEVNIDLLETRINLLFIREPTQGNDVHDRTGDHRWSAAAKRVYTSKYALVRSAGMRRDHSLRMIHRAASRCPSSGSG